MLWKVEWCLFYNHSARTSCSLSFAETACFALCVSVSVLHTAGICQAAKQLLDSVAQLLLCALRMCCWDVQW